MQVWGMGLGSRPVNLHRLSWSCSLPYSIIFSLSPWQRALRPPPPAHPFKRLFQRSFAWYSFFSFQSSFASLLSCMKCLFSKPLDASNPSVSRKIWIPTCSTFLSSFSETHVAFSNFGLLLEGGPMNTSEVMSLLFFIHDPKSLFCPNNRR